MSVCSDKCHGLNVVIDELKMIVGSQSDTINKALAGAVAILKLHTFFTDDDIFTKNDHKHGNALQNAELLMEKFPADIPLKAIVSSGLAFDETGQILFLSSNFFELYRSSLVIGDDINKLLFNASTVLDNVFIRNQADTVCQIKRPRNAYKRKKGFSILSGKRYQNHRGSYILASAS